jgi:hypothetical protein
LRAILESKNIGPDEIKALMIKATVNGKGESENGDNNNIPQTKFQEPPSKVCIIL